MILELLEESVERIEPDKKSLRIALESVNNMENIVSQLLAFARPSKVVLKNVVIRKIVDDSVLLVTPRLNKNNITLNKSYDPEILVIQADAVKLKESFVNLLVNAIQAITELEYSAEKVINISVKKFTLIKPVWNMSSYQDETSGKTNIAWEEKFGPTLAAGSDCVIVSFMDSGIGIKAEDLSHIFDPFFTTHKEGTGLGLATVKRIISEHNGVITAHSSKNKGTVFNLYFSK
jgi:signal transduction histidine kinase